MLTLCKECQKIERSAYGREWVAIVTIPWSQITSVVNVTGSVLLLTVVLHQEKSFTAGQERPFANSNNTANKNTITITSTDLLVAPCPASSLHRLFGQRIEMHSIRNQVTNYSVFMLHSPIYLCMYSCFSSFCATFIVYMGIYEYIHHHTLV